MKFRAESLVTTARVEAYGLEDDDFEQGEQDGLSDEQRQKEHSDAEVEGQDVRQRHQRQAFLAELPAQRGGEVGVRVKLTERVIESLEARGLVFLPPGVRAVEEEIQLLEPFAPPPPERPIALVLLFVGIQFAPSVAEGKPQVDVLVVVG